MIRASEPPRKWRRLSDFPVNACISVPFSESQSGMSATVSLFVKGAEMGHVCHNIGHKAGCQ